eukprot:TRINITY_DN74364_c0_g1_i1.p1 TRINITY_DN74364_c0_g1~~TRINITY_DN74364_c0_g1_i1.p1  ORF type:complete len:472 (+),score=70.32 TRINITY_DN74364_c0_g1_i1:97-1512(+)
MRSSQCVFAASAAGGLVANALANSSCGHSKVVRADGNQRSRARARDKNATSGVDGSGVDEGGGGRGVVRFVQVVHRHGARTPFAHRDFVSAIGTGDVGSPAWTSAWGKCRTPYVTWESSQHPSAQFSLTSEGSSSNKPLPGTYGTCFQGQLTTLGEEQARQLGSFLRGRYVDVAGVGKVGSLFTSDAVGPKAEEIVVSSTNTSRTLLSAQCMLRGFFPEVAEERLDAMVQVPTPDGSKERFIPNYAGCDRLRWHFNEGRDLVKASLSSRRVYERIEDEIGPRAATQSVVTVGDVTRALLAHGLPLPPGVSMDLAAELDAAGHQLLETVQGKGSMDVRRLSSGRLLADIDGHIRSVVEDASPLRCAVVSAHDTTVSALLTALGLSAPGWIKLAGSVLIELLVDENGRGDKWKVRVLFYDGVPDSQDAVPAIDTTVTLASWQAAMAHLTLSDDEFMQRCLMPLGEKPPPPHMW